MSEPARCQCTRCYRYLTENWRGNAEKDWEHMCAECHPGTLYRPPGIPLATLRGTITDPLSLEVLSLLDEECHETGQRINKIIRWGWEADFEGTTQRYKLENEMGDILAAMLVAQENGFIDMKEVERHRDAKLEKFREDAAGPRQRLLHAKVPK